MYKHYTYIPNVLPQISTYSETRMEWSDIQLNYPRDKLDYITQVIIIHWTLTHSTQNNSSITYNVETCLYITFFIRSIDQGHYQRLENYLNVLSTTNCSCFISDLICSTLNAIYTIKF